MGTGKVWVIGAALALWTWSGPASALQQPDGTTIPQTNRLVSVLNSQGETIDPLTQAATTPETFTPTCALTFNLIARGAPGALSSLRTSFGWYNVTGQKPANSELVEFISCSDPAGTSKILSIQNDPRYLGGDIGFFEASPEGKPGNCVDFSSPSALSQTLGYVYYSEKAYNADNTGPNSYIHLLIMDSKAFQNAFYFGWEDLYQGGDNDFEDLLMRVEGIACSQGGQACDTGNQGLCSFGTTQCIDGTIECLQNEQPGSESCNAIDDDCNGQVDDGDLCPPKQVCDRGTCVPRCGSGEFQCPPGSTCNSAGLCVDPACEMVSCNAGEVCVAGQCSSACSGVTCPFGQVCRSGLCIDPCAALNCDNGYYCEGGVCKLGCSCGNCPQGQACDSSNNHCVEPGCEGKSCAAGTHCSGGTCVDDCAGAVCPNGGACVNGVCESGTGGSAGSASGGSGADGGIVISGGAGGTSGSSGSAGSGSAARGSVEEDSGCGCRTAGGSGGAGLLASLALLAAFWRRRRASR